LTKTGYLLQTLTRYVNNGADYLNMLTTQKIVRIIYRKTGINPMKIGFIFGVLPRECTIVASMGRSGSTLVAKTLVDGANKFYLPHNMIKLSFQPDLRQANLEAGQVVKTHDYPESLNNRREPIKVIFVFGPAVESALSVRLMLEKRGRSWVEAHLRHLKSSATPEQILDDDNLKVYDQLRKWCTYEGHPTLCVHYDYLWDAQEEIARFIGRPFPLPPRKTRESKSVISDSEKRRAELCYGPIDKTIDRIPKCFIASKQWESIFSNTI